MIQFPPFSLNPGATEFWWCCDGMLDQTWSFIIIWYVVIIFKLILVVLMKTYCGEKGDNLIQNSVIIIF